MNSEPGEPVVLLILDGVGIAPDRASNAFTQAAKPQLGELLSTGTTGTAVCTTLRAHGTAVGLASDGDMGNSEVGHNILGAGRVFDQGPKQVAVAFENGSIWSDEWTAVVTHAKRSALHLVGLLSDGNIHSDYRQALAMAERALDEGVTNVYLHVLFDGRDVLDHTAELYTAKADAALQQLEARHPGCTARIATGAGRMSTTMDRYEADWGMVERGYRLMVEGDAELHSASTQDALAAIRAKFPTLSDQYLPAFVIDDAHGDPIGRIRDNDAVVLCNFRGDRMIEIYRALAEPTFDTFKRAHLPDLYVAGMTLYDGDAGIPKHFLVRPERVSGTLSEYLCAHNISQGATAETQKFGHVTYFWNGNRADKFDESLETYVEVPSFTGSFEDRPWMRSAETADAVIAMLDEGVRFVRANFAGGDMVGHTGSFVPARLAVEAIDLAIGRIRAHLRASGHGVLLITADHGNCEEMCQIGSDGTEMQAASGRCIPKTSHTTNLVPFIVEDFSGGAWSVSTEPGRGLSSVASTICEALRVPASSDFDPPVARRC